jgi:predicted PurR-regulated permease PerM
MPDSSTATRNRSARSTRLASFLQRVLIVAAVALGLALAWTWRHILLLVFAAILIACGLHGFAAQIRKLAPIGPKAAVAVAALCVAVALGGVAVFFGRQIAAQAATLADAAPQAWASLESRLAQSELGRQALEQARATASSDTLLGDLTRRIGRFGFSFASGALDAFLVVVAAIFFALNPQSYRDGLLRLAPRSLREQGRAALDTSGHALKKWLAGTLVSMLAMTVMVGLGLWALGVPAPLPLAILAGLAQFVPFIGPLLAAVPAILLALAIEPMTALWVALMYFAASTVEANILYPLIQKKAVDQPPVLTLFTVIAFGVVLGPLGAIVAVPLTVVITVFVVVFYIRGALGDDMAAPGER